MSFTSPGRSLWDQLLAGELIDVRAYRYSADRTLRPASEQPALAQQLGAGGAVHAPRAGDWSLWDGDQIGRLAGTARSRYPEKLVHVTTHKQIRLLRRVRSVDPGS